MKSPLSLCVVTLMISLALAACAPNPRTVIQQASKGVCGGETYPAAAAYSGVGLHPLVVSLADGERHSWNNDLPEAWFPAIAEQTQLVACVGEPAEVRVELCEYDGPDITRYRYDTRVWILEAKTGRVVAEQTFHGSEPRACGYSEDYDLTEIHGIEVGYSDVESWLKQYIESES